MQKRKNPFLLKIDKNYKPVSIEVGDEFYPNGIFVFNITKMQDFINNNKKNIALVNIAVKDYRKSFSKLNESHIDSVDISIPVILAEISPETYNVIDGNHRFEKAYRNGADSIYAYKLNVNQHLSFLTSTEAYHSYIDYWNEKIRDGYLPN